MSSPADSSILRGNHFVLTIRFILDGDPWPDIGAWTPKAQLKKQVNSRRVAATFEVTPDDDTSELEILLPDTITRDLSPGDYWWDIDFFDPNEPDGTKVVTWPPVGDDRCKLVVEADVTRVNDEVYE